MGIGNGILRFILRDRSGQDLDIESISGALPVIQTVHKELHDGELQRGYHYFGSVASTVSARLYVKTSPTQTIHLRIHADIAGDSLLKIIEAPTITVPGIDVPVFNMNRVVGDGGFNGVFKHTPSYSSGTEFYPEFIAGGSGGQVAASEQEAFEQLLKANTEYIIDVQNISGQARLMGVGATFYEHPED